MALDKKKQRQPVLWKTAVDQKTGQTYYYDAVTRKTQWEKPAELKAMEKQAKRERRKADRLFFREMERNIYTALAQGVLYQQTSKTTKQENLPQEDAQVKDESRVRTISGMDNVLLAQLEKPTQDHAAVVSTHNSRPPVEGRPPRPGTGATRPSSDQNDVLNDVATVENRPVDSEQLAGEQFLDGPIEENIKLEDGPLARPAHVRRNTGGTIFVKSTMTVPNIEATIKCVCGVFRAHILQASNKAQARDESSKTTPASPISPPSVAALQQHSDNVEQVFCDNHGLPKLKRLASHHKKQIPTLGEICVFYQDFYNRSQMEHDTIIMSLIYVERLIKEASISPTSDNWMSVLFSCMVLASKVWDDLSMWNVDFSHVCGRNHKGKSNNCFASFTLTRINQLELALLKSLRFNVKVPASEYAKYYFLIRSMLIKSGLLDEVVVANDNDNHNNNNALDMQGAKNLETLSSNYQETFATTRELQDANQNRRSKSMDGYFWFSHHDQKQVAPQEETRQPPTSFHGAGCGNRVIMGPVLKQSVCLEQLVSM